MRSVTFAEIDLKNQIYYRINRMNRQELEREFDEIMEGPLKSIKCENCDNIFCKKIYFNGKEGSYTKWMCKECFVRMKESLYSLKIELEKILAMEEKKAKNRKMGIFSFIKKYF